MNEAMNYIFKNMQYTDDNLKRIAKIIRKQGRINAKMSYIAFGLTALLAIQSKEVKNMSLRIKKLEGEIEKFKSIEEEY